jgi:hypothetical protein
MSTRQNSRPKRRAVTAKDFMKMNTEQLAEATKQYDREFVKTRPLTEEEKRQWERAKRKRGRPRVGTGAERISVTIEKRLLAKATKLAKKLRISRAQLISQGLRSMLVEHGAK